MTKNINWRNHFVEFVVVVAGILIAFQLNTCREQNREQQLVDEHLTYIAEETRFNIRNLEASIKFAKKLDSDIQALLAEVEGAKQVDSMNARSIRMLNVGGAYFKNNAYNSLIESGDVRFIKDFELKNNIINLYEYYRWVESFDTVNLETYKDYFFPYALDQLDLVTAAPQELEVYTNKKFRNIVGSYQYMNSARLIKYEDLKERMTNFLETLP